MIYLVSKCDCFGVILGHYSLPDGIVFSVPLTFTDGKWSVVSELTVENELKYRLELSASELQQVKLNQ